MSSVTKRNGSQVTLPRFGEQVARVVAEGLAEIYPGVSTERSIHDGYKRAAILSLKTSGGWTFEQIGRMFGHPKGHIQRLFKSALETCRDKFHMNPLLGGPSQDPDEEVSVLVEGDLNYQFGSLPVEQKRRALASVLGEPPV